MVDLYTVVSRLTRSSAHSFLAVLCRVKTSLYALFTLPIRSTRSNPIMQSGADRACSGRSTLVGITRASFPRIFDKSKIFE